MTLPSLGWVVAALRPPRLRAVATPTLSGKGRREMRQPCFQTHAVDVPHYLVLLTWYGAEIIMLFRQLGGARRLWDAPGVLREWRCGHGEAPPGK